MFKNPFSFKGRIRRLEYGLSYLIYLGSIFIIAMLMELTPGANILGILVLPLIWFMLAQGAKRCHDRGNSGIYQIIPLYGLWMIFADSDYGDNKYGPNPKGIGNYDEVEEIGKELVY